MNDINLWIEQPSVIGLKDGTMIREQHLHLINDGVGIDIEKTVLKIYGEKQLRMEHIQKTIRTF